MPDPAVSGFSIIRNATLLDFPLEASIRSVLPGVDEFVLAVGASEDDTRSRVERLAAEEPKLRLVDTVWDTSVGSAVLSNQTNIALAACRGRWGIYIQADEVLADGGAEALRAQLLAADGDRHVEGLVVEYRHFYGGLDTIGVSRGWYRREVRAVRLGVGVHSHGDAQGFRVGTENRRVRCRRSGVTMFHYGWARPAWALQAKRKLDHEIYPTERRKDPERPLLPWFPGLRRFTGAHPTPVAEWIAARRNTTNYIEAPRYDREALRLMASLGIEQLTGWRPFEYRNYTLVA
jgi:hypothetical protein